MSILLSSRNDDSLDLRSQFAVGISYRPFRLEVYHIADTAHNMAYATLTACINGEITIFYHTDSIQSGSRLSDDFEFLFIGEETSFVNIDTYSDNHLIKHAQSSFENVQMTSCKRIERPGE